jgi:hypothetical protein
VRILPSAAGLTDATHQAFEQTLTAAIDDQSKAVVAIQAWKAGDPPPPALHDLVVSVQAALVSLQQLTGNPSVTKIADSLQQAVNIVAAIQGAMIAAK